MSDQQTWVEALNISSEMLEKWGQEVPSGTPLLVWCLQEGLVSVAEYLEWAREHYALPVLSSAFFESQGFDPSYLRSPDALSTWQPWCFPVSRWENVTYIACVEPPREETAPHTCYILADPRVLREAWETETSEPSLDEMPLTPVVHKLEDDGPIGINMSPSKSTFKLNLGDDGDVLSGDVFSSEVAGAAEQEESVKTSTFVMDDEIVSELRIVRSEPAVSESDLMPNSAATSAPPTVAPAKVAQMTPIEAKSEFTNVGTITTSEQDLVAKSIGFLTQFYTSVAIFKVVEGVAVFQYADKDFKLPKGKKPKLDLSYPSFLRVVHKTEHPYHGYLVDTPTHHEFFEDMGLSFLPTCVTAVPVKLNGQTWGMMVAIGDDKNRPNEHIAQVEKAVSQLVQNMGPIWSNAA